MIKVHNEVKVCEIDGEHFERATSPLIVDSHWNRASLVVLQFGETRITVLASELQAAIQNATNTRPIA